MDITQDSLITFRPTETARKILKINAENNGMNENELMNHFIENNSSKHRPVIDKHENTIKSQSEKIEGYQEEIESLKDDKSNLQIMLQDYKSKVEFLNKEKSNFVPDTAELEFTMSELEKAKTEIAELMPRLKEYHSDVKRLSNSLGEYETDLLDDCFWKVQGSILKLHGDESEQEFEILEKADLVNALLTQYALHLKGFETDIDEEDEEDED
jgi:chromosome segregation ATPase